MNKEKLNMLETYLKTATTPILLENITSDVFKNAVILGADCDVSLLNGHYEEINFVAPDWYNNLLAIDKNLKPILVIDGINKISVNEQNKFIEILKYKKISTFELPENCIIVVLAYDIKNNKISEEIYSLVAHI